MLVGPWTWPVTHLVVLDGLLDPAVAAVAGVAGAGANTRSWPAPFIAASICARVRAASWQTTQKTKTRKLPMTTRRHPFTKSSGSGCFTGRPARTAPTPSGDSPRSGLLDTFRTFNVVLNPFFQQIFIHVGFSVKS